MSRRTKNTPEDSGGDEFMVLFTALSMILLAFFIMLNTLATIDETRSRIVVNSLVGTFGVLPGYQQGKVGPKLPHQKQSKQRKRQLRRRVQGLIEINDLEGMEVAEREDGRVVIRFDARILFASGAKTVNPRAFPTLDKLGGLIERIGFPVRIEGHSDARPNPGRQSNWYLSAARAAAVYRYLRRAVGVPADLLSAAGYGASRSGSETPEQGRRVEIVFLPPTRQGGQK